MSSHRAASRIEENRRLPKLQSTRQPCKTPRLGQPTDSWYQLCINLSRQGTLTRQITGYSYHQPDKRTPTHPTGCSKQIYSLANDPAILENISLDTYKTPHMPCPWYSPTPSVTIRAIKRKQLSAMLNQHNLCVCMCVAQRRDPSK